MLQPPPYTPLPSPRPQNMSTFATQNSAGKFRVSFLGAGVGQARGSEQNGFRVEGGGCRANAATPRVIL